MSKVPEVSDQLDLSRVHLLRPTIVLGVSQCPLRVVVASEGKDT